MRLAQIVAVLVFAPALALPQIASAYHGPPDQCWRLHSHQAREHCEWQRSHYHDHGHDHDHDHY
jgi:hypothetical protein